MLKLCVLSVVLLYIQYVVVDSCFSLKDDEDPIFRSKEVSVVLLALFPLSITFLFFTP